MTSFALSEDCIFSLNILHAPEPQETFSQLKQVLIAWLESLLEVVNLHCSINYKSVWAL